MSEEERSITERVYDFLEDSLNSDEACALVFTLYDTVLELASENSVLEMETSLLKRELEIAEKTITRLNKEKKEVQYTA